MAKGIDISNHQGEVDWDQIAASGQEFAIFKASEGTGFTDPWFARNWTEARRVGMVRGAYHFGRPSENTPEAEADHFLSVVQNAGGLRAADLLALDMEDTDVAANQSLLNWTLTWLRYVEQRVGFRPLLYSGVWYLQPHNLLGNAELAEYGLWLASYQDQEPRSPAPWPVLAIWQHTDKGRVPGVAGNCDLDVFNGSLDQLRLYGKPAAIAPPPPPPGVDKAAILARLANIEREAAAIRALLA